MDSQALRREPGSLWKGPLVEPCEQLGDGKEANSPSFVSWHQDSQYWGLDSENLVTVWVALSASNVASGYMRYLPGSHRGPGLPHRET